MTTSQTLRTGGDAGYLRIATEEAWGPIEMFDVYRDLLARGEGGPGFHSLIGHYLTNDAERPRFVRDRLVDLGEARLADMDAAGVDHAVLALTSPGTQSLEPEIATKIAALSNDRLAEAVQAHPSRFSGLAAVGFEDVPTAVRELERGVGQLGLRGLICNSHIRGHYLDEQQFWPILEALEDLGVPLYLHPNTPNDTMLGTLNASGLDGAIYGFAVETGMHLLKIITSGLLDRFPRLKIAVGHLGEAIPFWLYRVDYMHAGQVASKRYDAIRPLELKPSEYMRRNVWVTTSGMPAVEPIMFAREVLGADRVMYAMDYPYEYVPEEVAMQETLPLSLEEKRQFFQDNAIDLFGLDASVIGAR